MCLQISLSISNIHKDEDVVSMYVLTFVYVHIHVSRHMVAYVHRIICVGCRQAKSQSNSSDSASVCPGQDPFLVKRDGYHWYTEHQCRCRVRARERERERESEVDWEACRCWQAGSCRHRQGGQNVRSWRVGALSQNLC